jgi:tripartite-type tricarboxylate transporter receptor subunit TctC
MTYRRFLRFAAALSLATTSALACAQDWPNGPVRVIVPFDAGSTPDIVARLVSERLHARFGPVMIVENKSGASGNIGTDAVAKAKSDGQTIGVSIAGPLAINPLLFKKMPYDPARDLDALTVAVSQPSVLVVGTKHGLNTPKDLLALLKDNQSKLSFASIGAGSVSHLAMETLAAGSNSDVIHAPYRGSAAAVTAVLSGEVDMALLPAAAVMPHIKAGKLRGLAVASAKRSPSLPDLPTFAEGGLPEVQADAWIGFIAPAKTPESITRKLTEQIGLVLNEPAVKEKFASQYMDVVASSPDAFRALLASDVARWKPIIQKYKIALD